MRRIQYQPVTEPPRVAVVVSVPTQFGSIYPDFARAPAGLLAADAPSFFFVNLDTVAAPLSWQGAYADFAGRQPSRLHPALQPSAFFISLDTARAPLSWRPSYDDFAGRQAPRAVEFPSFAFVSLDTARAPLSWHPSYDDFAGRQPPRAPEFPAYFFVNRDTAPSPYAWGAVYDDFTRGAARLVEFPAHFFTESDVPPLSWLAQYPDLLVPFGTHPPGSTMFLIAAQVPPWPGLPVVMSGDED